MGREKRKRELPSEDEVARKKKRINEQEKARKDKIVGGINDLREVLKKTYGEQDLSKLDVLQKSKEHILYLESLINTQAQNNVQPSQNEGVQHIAIQQQPQNFPAPSIDVQTTYQHNSSAGPSYQPVHCQQDYSTNNHVANNLPRTVTSDGSNIFIPPPMISGSQFYDQSTTFSSMLTNYVQSNHNSNNQVAQSQESPLSSNLLIHVPNSVQNKKEPSALHNPSVVTSTKPMIMMSKQAMAIGLSMPGDQKVIINDQVPKSQQIVHSDKNLVHVPKFVPIKPKPSVFHNPSVVTSTKPMMMSEQAKKQQNFLSNDQLSNSQQIVHSAKDLVYDQNSVPYKQFELPSSSLTQLPAATSSKPMILAEQAVAVGTPITGHQVNTINAGTESQTSIGTDSQGSTTSIDDEDLTLPILSPTDIDWLLEHFSPETITSIQ